LKAFFIILFLPHIFFERGGYIFGEDHNIRKGALLPSM
jgi:hypothetical protein